jgi:hypothetical protein
MNDNTQASSDASEFGTRARELITFLLERGRAPRSKRRAEEVLATWVKSWLETPPSHLQAHDRLAALELGIVVRNMRHGSGADRLLDDGTRQQLRRLQLAWKGPHA